MARKRTTQSAAVTKPGQLGMVYGQVRRATTDVDVLDEAPVPFATLIGDWLTEAGFPAGQRYLALSDKRGLITLVAVPDDIVWSELRRERGTGTPRGGTRRVTRAKSATKKGR